jgi:hypothetical protein
MSVAQEEPIKGELPEIASTSASPSPEDLAIDGHDDAEGLHGTPPPPPKRKGGRKPVSYYWLCIPSCLWLITHRYIPLRKRGNNVIVRPKLPFGRGAQNTLSNWRSR